MNFPGLKAPVTLSESGGTTTPSQRNARNSPIPDVAEMPTTSEPRSVV